MMIRSLFDLGNKSGVLNKALNKPFAKNLITNLCDPRALLPVIALDIITVTGRSIQAEKRGGEIEYKERLREELSTSAVWLFGITALNKTFDFLAKNLLKIDTAIDFGAKKDSKNATSIFDYLKNPIDRFFDGKKPVSKKWFTALKYGKIGLSAATAIYIIGSIIPRFNQAMTKKTLAQQKLSNNPQTFNHSSAIPYGSMQSFLQNTKNKGLSFKGNGQILNSLSHLGYNLENDQIYKLLTVDAGLTEERYRHARNKPEKKEILIREIPSIPCYVFVTPMVAGGMASAFDKKLGINTKITPYTAEIIENKILDEFDNNSHLTLQGLKDKMLGNGNTYQNMAEKAAYESRHSKVAALNHQLLASDQLMVIANELGENPSSQKISALAHEMYQSGISGKKAGHLEVLAKDLEKTNFQKAAEKVRQIAANSPFIAADQIPYINNGNVFDSPEFTGEILSKATNIQNPTKFVPKKEINSIKQNARTYTERLFDRLSKKLSGNSIDRKTLETELIRTKNLNSVMKGGYTLTGMAIAGTFLGYIIPKVQCYITKKQTGDNSFPGIMDLRS